MPSIEDHAFDQLLAESAPPIADRDPALIAVLGAVSRRARSAGKRRRILGVGATASALMLAGTTAAFAAPVIFGNWAPDRVIEYPSELAGQCTIAFRFDSAPLAHGTASSSERMRSLAIEASQGIDLSESGRAAMVAELHARLALPDPAAAGVPPHLVHDGYAAGLTPAAFEQEAVHAALADAVDRAFAAAGMAGVDGRVVVRCAGRDE